MINKKILLLFFSFIHFKSYSQNLFANPSFEAVNTCIEYQADCAPEAWFNIPANNYGVNARVLSNAVYGNSVLYLPVGSVLQNFNKPRFVYTALCCPLVANEKYILSFFISVKKIKFTNLCIYFTGQEPTLSTTTKLNLATPIIITAANFDDDYKEEWKHVFYEYTAKGNERFFTLTTLGLPTINYEMDEAMNKSGDVFYFLDEMVLKSKKSIPLCKTYESTINKLFAQNYRHTDNIKIEEEEAPKPVFITKTDTILISGLLFDVNKSAITKKLSITLDSIALQLNDSTVKNILIVGHTDNSGDSLKNEKLSFDRSYSIKNYFTTKLPQLTTKIQAEGKGQRLPKATNKTTQGKQKNRRVEIIITRK